MTALGLHASGMVALATYAYSAGSFAMRGSFLGALVVTAPGTTKFVRSSQMLALVPYAAPTAPEQLPRASQMLVAVVYGNNTLVEGRSRAWTFTLDGHPFYVLDLGQEGTFVFDLTTKQWSNFATNGHIGWNMKNGTMWDTTNRILGGDSNYPYVWELTPDEPQDEGFKPIDHVVTGGIPTRSRVYITVSALRLAASAGNIMGDTGVIMNMRFSDDNAKTWSDYYPITLTSGDFSQELAWRSLGAFMAPGRIFEISDSGGLLRIDGADVFLDGFDDERLQQNPTGGGDGGNQQG